MDNYFKTLHSVADTNDKTYDSLIDLTIAVAKSGGYRRGCKTLKCGKKVMRTLYNNPGTWDNTLVAKWLCKFEALFRSKLCPHPELREFFPDIIQRTFTIYFNALQIDRLQKDSTISTTVYMCLANRIGEALIAKGSKERLQRFNSYENTSKPRKSQDRIIVCSILNSISDSYESLTDHDLFVPDFYNKKSDMLLDLTRRLSRNPFGERLLNAMTYSTKTNSKGKALPIDFTVIRDYMYLSADEIADPTTKVYLNAAYSTIISTVKEYFPNYDYKNLNIKSFKIKKISKHTLNMDKQNCIIR